MFTIVNQVKSQLQITFKKRHVVNAHFGSSCFPYTLTRYLRKQTNFYRQLLC